MNGPMSTVRLARCLILLASVVAVAPGCEAFYAYRPVSVLVKDVETEKPIAGARVCITYPLACGSAPCKSIALTGQEGIARLEAAPCGNIAIRAEVTAKGYMDEEKYLSVEAVRAIKRAGFFEDVDRRPPSFVLEMYAEPVPTVELVVPTGYRGVIVAEVTIQADAPRTPGQRCFRYMVSPTGAVQVTGPPLLGRVLPATFTARYADGTPLSRDPRDTEIGFWWLKHDGRSDSFLIGTRSEWKRSRPSDDEGATRSHNRSDGQGGGGGRRNRKGSQSGADSGGDGT
jgi:hypothetical protein